MQGKDYIKNRNEVAPRLSKMDEALNDLTQSILLNPRDSQTYRFRSMIYVDKGDYDKALADCQHMLEINPNDAYAHNALAEVYDKVFRIFREISQEQMGLLEKAITAWTEALKYDPNNPDWLGCRY